MCTSNSAIRGGAGETPPSHHYVVPLPLLPTYFLYVPEGKFRAETFAPLRSPPTPFVVNGMKKMNAFRRLSRRSHYISGRGCVLRGLSNVSVVGGGGAGGGGGGIPHRCPSFLPP